MTPDLDSEIPPLSHEDDEKTTAVRALAPPVSDWERYELVEFLGEGGMGQVWKARDQRLERMVALKFLSGRSPELLRRFQREARTQARVDHPRVCTVHEVGEVDGRPYIAMQYIPGRSLDRVAPKLSLEQRVVLIRDVAEALHAAHRLGLVHRDVKPANILVEESDAGDWRPYVVDFGLARELSDPGLTHTGEIVGTPGYLSPEQVRGEPADRRTDVYGLGVTMYQTMTGSPPFAGTMTGVLLKILNDDPAPPRRLNPSLPRDLEIVVLKCLEKEPHRRYESARALSDDLDRYLEGEPISARRSSLAYRLGRRLRKHRLAVAIAAIGLLTTVALAGMWLQSKRSAARRATLAQRFGREMEQVESLLRVAHRVPLHDLRPELREMRERLRRIDDECRSLGRLARGPGLYALGRGHLALGEYRTALEHLEGAWEAGFRGPEVAYALGLAMGRLYSLQLEAIERVVSPELRQARSAEARAGLRDRAVQFLRLSGGAVDAPAAYVEGLIAFHEGRYEAALAHAETALRQRPWFHDGHLLVVDIRMAMASELADRGGVEDAVATLGLAAQACRAAARIGESDPEVYERQCALENEMVEISLETGVGDPEEAASSALEACGQALQANPDRARPRGLRSATYFMLAMHRGRAGADPSEAFARARVEAEAAVGLEPEDEEALNYLGIVLELQASYLRFRGGDPEPLWTEAAGVFERALALHPRHAAVLNNLGLLYRNWGRWNMDRGRDPRGYLRRAAGYLDEAITIYPELVIARGNLCTVHKNLAAYEIDHGGDPTDSLTLAEEACRQALQRNPEYADGYSALGNVHGRRASYLAQRGTDPRPTLREAIAAHRRAAELSPQRQVHQVNLAQQWRELAAAELEWGGDPTTPLRSARASWQRAAELAELVALDYGEMAELEIVAARIAAAGGEDPSQVLERARGLLEHAIELDPGEPTFRGRAESLARLTAELRSGGRDE